MVGMDENVVPNIRVSMTYVFKKNIINQQELIKFKK